MILAELNPLSTSVAIPEIVIILLIAALIGYLVGRWITKGQLSRLQQVFETKEGELSECQDRHKVPVIASGIKPVEAIVKDDLKLIEGIGPAIEKLLNAGNILSFSQLANSEPDTLAAILRAAGPRFQIHDPATWPEQAGLARDGKWEELDQLQDRLTGGRG